MFPDNVINSKEDMDVSYSKAGIFDTDRPECRKVGAL